MSKPSRSGGEKFNCPQMYQPINVSTSDDLIRSYLTILRRLIFSSHDMKHWALPKHRLTVHLLHLVTRKTNPSLSPYTQPVSAVPITNSLKTDNGSVTNDTPCNRASSSLPPLTTPPTGHRLYTVHKPIASSTNDGTVNRDSEVVPCSEIVSLRKAVQEHGGETRHSDKKQKTNNANNDNEVTEIHDFIKQYRNA